VFQEARELGQRIRIMLTRGERIADALAEFSGLLKHTDARFKELWANEADEVWDAL